MQSVWLFHISFESDEVKEAVTDFGSLVVVAVGFVCALEILHQSASLCWSRGMHNHACM